MVVASHFSYILRADIMCAVPYVRGAAMLISIVSDRTIDSMSIH